MAFPIFGKNPSGEHLRELMKFPNYGPKGFENLSPTPMISEDASYPKMMWDFFKPRKGSTPPRPLPSVKTDLHANLAGPASVVWFGHSSYLIQLRGKNFLFDPVFSGSASLFSFMVKAFPGTDVYQPADMPVIDYLVLTHDHYDHLDYKTILNLKLKVRHVICSSGVSSHLAYWGYQPALIRELYWWQSEMLEAGIKITAAPGRHFSGRGTVRGRTLWSSFILETEELSLFAGGDSGYDTHFREIGERFGPFELAILECGQYNKSWPYIHMMPEETVKAAEDLRARVLMPVHWGKFSLALHSWDEPIKELVKKAQEAGQPITTPRIGELVKIGEHYPRTDWWTVI